MKTKILFGVILVMVAAMTVAPEVWAKDVQAQEEQNEFTLEEITVTATKRETALEDTPLAISVVTGDMINEQGRNDIYDILKDIPGLTFGTEYGGEAPHSIFGVLAAAFLVGTTTVILLWRRMLTEPMPLRSSAARLISASMILPVWSCCVVPRGHYTAETRKGAFSTWSPMIPAIQQEASGTIELGNYQSSSGNRHGQYPVDRQQCDSNCL